MIRGEDADLLNLFVYNFKLDPNELAQAGVSAFLTRQFASPLVRRHVVVPAALGPVRGVARRVRQYRRRRHAGGAGRARHVDTPKGRRVREGCWTRGDNSFDALRAAIKDAQKGGTPTNSETWVRVIEQVAERVPSTKYELRSSASPSPWSAAPSY